MKAVLKFQSKNGGYISPPAIYILNGITLRINGAAINFPYQETMTSFEFDEVGRLNITTSLDNLTDKAEYNAINIKNTEEILDIGLECFEDVNELYPIELELVYAVFNGNPVAQDIVDTYNIYLQAWQRGWGL